MGFISNFIASTFYHNSQQTSLKNFLLASALIFIISFLGQVNLAEGASVKATAAAVAVAAPKPAKNGTNVQPSPRLSCSLSTEYSDCVLHGYDYCDNSSYPYQCADRCSSNYYFDGYTCVYCAYPDYWDYYGKYCYYGYYGYGYYDDRDWVIWTAMAGTGLLSILVCIGIGIACYKCSGCPLRRRLNPNSNQSNFVAPPSSGVTFGQTHFGLDPLGNRVVLSPVAPQQPQQMIYAVPPQQLQQQQGVSGMYQQPQQHQLPQQPQQQQN